MTVEWKSATLGDVASTALGKMLDKGKDSGLTRVPYLRNINVQWGRIDTDDLLTMEFRDEDLDRFSVEPGDLLVCEGGEIGRAAIWRGPHTIAYQKALHRVRPNADLDVTFLQYLLEHYHQDGTLARYSTGSTIAHLPQQQLRRIPLRYPDLAEQRRIVEILEDHLSHLDAAEGLLTAASRRRAAWAAATLDQTALGSSEGMAPLASLVDRIEAGRSFGGPAAAAAEDEWGIIKVSAMTWGEFRPAENKRVPDDLANPAFEIKAGDLLVSRANTSAYVGAPVLVRETRPRLLLSDKSLRLIPKAGVDTEWLAAVLASRSSRSQISKIATGTSDSMRNISQKSLLSIAVPSASVKQQQAVIYAVRANREAGQRIALHVSEATARSANLRRSLLAAAFSGQLTGRASDLERAEEAIA